MQGTWGWCHAGRSNFSEIPKALVAYLFIVVVPSFPTLRSTGMPPKVCHIYVAESSRLPSFASNSTFLMSSCRNASHDSNAASPASVR